MTSGPFDDLFFSRRTCVLLKDNGVKQVLNMYWIRIVDTNDDFLIDELNLEVIGRERVTSCSCAIPKQLAREMLPDTPDDQLENHFIDQVLRSHEFRKKFNLYICNSNHDETKSNSPN